MTLFDKRGRVRTYARRTITHLARSKKGKVCRLNARLTRLVCLVDKKFPGHEIVIVSGYRPHRRGRHRSMHSMGRALDFRVKGISNAVLYNYLKTLPRVGVGYYPNSIFVHLDVRQRKYLWTDLSGPGEPARYVKSGQTTEAPGQATVEQQQLPDPENFVAGE